MFRFWRTNVATRVPSPTECREMLPVLRGSLVIVDEIGCVIISAGYTLIFTYTNVHSYSIYTIVLLDLGAWHLYIYYIGSKMPFELNHRVDYEPARHPILGGEQLAVDMLQSSFVEVCLFYF